MISVPHVAYLAGYGLLFITVVTSAYALWRRRDLQRIDILVVVASQMISAFLGRTTTYFLVARALLLLSQPFFLLRLVRHFRDLPRMLLATVVALIPIGVAVMIVWRPVPTERPLRNRPVLLRQPGLFRGVCADTGSAPNGGRDRTPTSGGRHRHLGAGGAALSGLALVHRTRQ